VRSSVAIGIVEIEARVAGLPRLPDGWHASVITTVADLAPLMTTSTGPGAG